ncbi:1408_t:CDS:1, partial [Funneliformis mosseae]
MSQSFSPQYYESLKLFKNKLLGPEKTIEEAKHQMDDLIVPIPDNIIVNEIKLDERYRIKSKEYLEDGLKKYEDVVDEKWKDFDDGGLCGEWIRVKDEGEKSDGSNLGKIKVTGR